MRQAGVDDTIKLQTYLVDAGSTDGTVEAIEEYFPDVNLIRCDSSVFWCGGVRIAFDEAMKDSHDYFLWLNDDTMLFQSALQALLDTAYELRQQEGKAGIIVGSTRDPKIDYCTYGGVVRRSKWRPMAYRRLEPSGKPQRCITMNGNCVLIPWEVAESIGNLSPEFTHSLGDFDYGLRASAKGISIWIVPTYIGECSRNPLKPWVDPEISLRRRLEILLSRKGLPPREFLLYIKRHAGIYWPIHVLALYIRVLFPRLYRPYSKKHRYFV